MASITIRRLEDATKERLRIRASRHGRSMEEEARRILNTVLAGKGNSERSLAHSVQRRFGALGGVDLADVPRQPMRRPPKFDK
jgi:antitoxin FitA